MDLVDSATRGREVPTLRAKCWRSAWAPIKLALTRAGLALEEGAVVRIRGYLDLYAPRGELGFIVTAIDLEALQLATLGEHARRREALLRKLEAEGLLEVNRTRPFPVVPLRVGLVASRGTEGYNDFVGMLEASGFSFQVTLAKTAVQGARAIQSVVSAIRALESRGAEVICVVRGGGSQADLATFDHEAVARAVAACPVPVLTGIGHTGDVSVADLAASRSFRTPTACAEALAAIVRDWYGEHVAGAAQRIVDTAGGVLDETDDGLAQARRHLVVVARHRLERAGDALSVTCDGLARRPSHALDRAGARVAAVSRRVPALARHRLERTTDELGTRRALLAAYDPSRLLARGWSITTDAAGTVVRSVATLTPGTELVTRVADGVARSTVTGATAAPAEGTP